MKVKIINKNSLDNGKEFKVRRMNYDQVVVTYPGDKGIEVFEIESVEFISETDMDDFLINHRYLLKIKINRGVSVLFYRYLFDELEKVISHEIEDLKVLKDSFKPASKRGIWEKNIVIMLNHKYPIEVNIIGENFKKNSYKYDVKELTEEELKSFCEFNIERLEKEIEGKSNQLGIFLDIKDNLKQQE